MPFVEQILYGSESGQRGAPRSVLAQSPGMGAEVAAEIRRLCDNWGDLPVAGLAAPALASVPLKATMPAMRGQLWAVLRLAPGDAGFVHGVVLGDADFAAYGRNPFALVRAVTFLDEWRVGLIMDRRSVTEIADSHLVATPPGRGDLALVTEAIKHLLTKGKLLLPLEQPGPEADRALALIIAALPAPMRRELRFASWSTSEANGWTIAAMGKTGCPFGGWQRLLLAEVAAIVPDAVAQYARQVGERIAAGDLPGLCRVGRDQVTVPGSGPRTAAAPTRGRGPAPVAKRVAAPAARETTPPAAAPPRHPARPAAAAGPLPRHPARPSGAAGSAAVQAPRPPAQPAAAPPPSQPPAPAAAAPAPVHPARRGGLASAAGMPAPEDRSARPAVGARAAARARLARAGRAVGTAGRGRPRLARIVPLALCGLLLAVVCWWKMPAIAAYVGERYGWFRPAEPAADHGVTTLLQVVDVGDVYRRQLAAVARAGVDPQRDQDRRKVKLAFQSEAAGPLLQQVDLFAALAADGIQQGGRPDREAERLRALAGQGRILEQELRRLELAWFSLAEGVDWRDLGTLRDDRVAARRDSLQAASRGALEEASRAVGAADAWPRLRTGRQHVAGMSGLLGAFAAQAWSAAWEEDLFAAAEKVSPAASDATRAYRNSAFALVRLKRAERSAAARELPFAEAFGDGVWPAPEVRDVLADLRRQVRRFDAGAVPPVLAGTVELYAALEKAGTLAREAAGGEVLAALARNPAVAFDPARYGDYLERLRFEAARAAAAAGADSTGLPDHLYAGRDSVMAGRFRAALAETTSATAWRIESLTQEHPFLARWAERQADRALAREQERRARFDGEWQQCLDLQAQVRARAAEGRDWTAQWLDLRDRAVDLLGVHVRRTGGDREVAARLGRAADLVRAMGEPRLLGLAAATVRLAPDVLQEPLPVVVELLVVGRTAPVRSAPFTVGPAAPAGTGWVGNAALDWRVNVGADDALMVRVLDPAGRELLRVDCPSLNERVGPGALARPRGTEAGTVSFQLDPAWWTRPDLPDLQ